MDPQSPASVPPQSSPLVLQGPVRVIIEQPGSRFFRVVKMLFWAFIALMVVGGVFSSAAKDRDIGQKHHSLATEAPNKIAVIKVSGLISGEEGFVKKQIELADKDPKVKAIVLRVDSPGGTVTGSDFIYHHLKKLVDDKKIPLVVSMGGVAASGGYYVSMAAGDGAKNIFAEPTTWTGSVGVIIPHYDLSGLLEKIDVTDDSVASAKYKQMGSPTRKLSPTERAEEREVLQGLVNDCFADFKEIVLKSRPGLRANAEWQATVFSGRIFTAKQALQVGLVDELGFEEDAVNRALELAHLTASNTEVIEYTKPSAISDIIFGAESRASTSIDLSSLLGKNGPRAYYLCAWPELSREK